MERYRFSPNDRAMLEHMKVPFAVFQQMGNRIVTLLVSDGFCDTMGNGDREKLYEAMDRDTFSRVHPDDVARVGNATMRFMREGGRFDSVYRLRKKDGSGYLVIHGCGEHVLTDTGVRLTQVWYVNEGDYVEDGDIQAGLNACLSNAVHEESLIRTSYYDELTGLPNMTRFFEQAEVVRRRVVRRGMKPVMLYMDLSGMKFYNTRYGFAEGDRLLRTFAGLLAEVFGSERCCRVGADHFAAVSEQTGMDERLERMLERWQTALEGRVLPVHVGVYQGRAEEDIHASTAMDRAKMACVAIRDKYGIAVNHYSQALSDAAEKRQYIVENIDRAIAEGWIQIYFQPIIRAVNGKISNVEALARWIDPVKGFMSPADFIPALEDAGLIYKLDLHMLDQLVDMMRRQMEAGYQLVPHSINLSRSDFDACDVVEEICRRVDAAGVARDRVTIEITESMIGSDFDFIKTQVERFRAMGFPVWMDDFGSGYSSLDVLQSIKFDLLKFDMSFMQRLDAGENGKIILTELMRMATALGVDTICEGVERAEQVRFLQEIGCSKLQGFYYSKPVSLETVTERVRSGMRLGFENPAESAYYENIGRINLYDLTVVTSKETRAFQNTFNTIPMGIIEVNGGASRFVRCNRSYRNFIKGLYGLDLTVEGAQFHENSSAFMRNVVKNCCGRSALSLYDEKTPDGSVVHALARPIGVNPVTGNTAVAVAVLSVTEPSDEATYADIARALAGDYYSIYVVDLDTDKFIEYTSPMGKEELAMERHGEDFFAVATRDTMTRIYEEDREPFLARFSKEKVMKELDARGVYVATYRLMDTGVPMYASLKITRMQPNENRIIIGVSIIEDEMKRKEEDEQERERNTLFRRIAALSGRYYALYTIDPDTGFYYEYSVSSDYSALGYDKVGDNFFEKGRQDGMAYIFPEDLPRFLEQFTRENVLRDIDAKGRFQIRYRIMVGGVPKPINLRMARVSERDGEKLVAGVSILDSEGAGSKE